MVRIRNYDDHLEAPKEIEIRVLLKQLITKYVRSRGLEEEFKQESGEMAVRLERHLMLLSGS